MSLHEKIEEYVETADTGMAADLMDELARLAWETKQDPRDIGALHGAGITQEDLDGAYGEPA
jgi:hypothetical protein